MNVIFIQLSADWIIARVKYPLQLVLVQMYLLQAELGNKLQILINCPEKKIGTYICRTPPSPSKLGKLHNFLPVSYRIIFQVEKPKRIKTSIYEGWPWLQKQKSYSGSRKLNQNLNVAHNLEVERDKDFVRENQTQTTNLFIDIFSSYAIWKVRPGTFLKFLHHKSNILSLQQK